MSATKGLKFKLLGMYKTHCVNSNAFLSQEFGGNLQCLAFL